jgi:hypothetical protein
MILINALHKKPLKRDLATLQYALVKAYHHDSEGHQKIWAVATDSKNKIIAESGNSYVTTHPLQRKYSKLCHAKHERDDDFKNRLHAEIGIIARLLKEHRSCDKIFIARAGYVQRQGNSRPCAVCQKALEDLGKVKIFWTE